MQLRRLLLKTIVIFSLVGLVACSDDDNETTNNQPESDVTSPDTDDEGTPDVTEDEDTADQEDVDESNDVTEEDVDETGDTEEEVTCEEGSDARHDLAREQFAQNEGINAGEVTFTVEDDGNFATVDAASGGTAGMNDESFIYIDLDTNQKLDISDVEAYDNTEWDIAFKRTLIRLNSADSGAGSWMAARVDAGWATAAPPASDGGDWKTDTFIDDTCELIVEGRDSLTTAFGVWYDYDMSTHQFTVPEDTTWFLYNMTSHTVLKFEIQSLEDMYYTIHWDAPAMGQ